MPTKRKTTIAAAEKRSIKSEISTLKKAHRKIDSDFIAEDKRIGREIQKLKTQHLRALKSTRLEMHKITRRLSILQARL